MGAGKVIVGAGVAFALVFSSLLALSTASASCGGGTVSTAKTDNLGAVTIINAAAELRLDTRAATIAMMTGMGESSLRNLDHGDAMDNTTIGVFQQGESYGARADRLDPKKAATAFLARLVKAEGWQSMAPAQAAHTVQIN